MNKPVAWMLKTGHGTKILEVKPYCEVDLWTPLYTHPHPDNLGLAESIIKQQQSQIEILKLQISNLDLENIALNEELESYLFK